MWTVLIIEFPYGGMNKVLSYLQSSKGNDVLAEKNSLGMTAFVHCWLVCSEQARRNTYFTWWGRDLWSDPVSFINEVLKELFMFCCGVVGGGGKRADHWVCGYVEVKGLPCGKMKVFSLDENHMIIKNLCLVVILSTEHMAL